MGFRSWLMARLPQNRAGFQDDELDPPPPYTEWDSQVPPQQPRQLERPVRQAIRPPMLPPPTIPGASTAWPIPIACPFHDLTSCWTMMQYFVPEGFNAPLEHQTPDYLASLCLFAKDLPGLMKHGFHWDMANVIPQGGFVDCNRPGRAWAGTKQKLAILSLDHTRYWILQDSGEDPQWAATISINAKEFPTLANFDLTQQLAPRNIIAAAARSPGQHWVYSYNRHYPDHDFNTIYNDTVPMEGCWPPQGSTEVVREPKPENHSKLNYQLLLPGDAMEIHFYRHFFNKTISDMSISRCLNTKFWKQAFRAPSQDEECVWHVTVALGVNHWMFTLLSSRNVNLERFAFDQYNRAISALMECTSKAQKGEADPAMVLVCCFLFVLLESLRGNYNEAIRHLDSGSKRITNNVPNISVSEDIKQLAAMFHVIGSQLSLFSDDRLLPDLTPFSASMKKYKTQRQGYQDGEEENSECDRCRASLGQQVRDWSTDFNYIVEDVTISSQDFDTRKRILNLKLQHRLWEFCVDAEKPTSLGCELDQDQHQGDQTLEPAECGQLLNEIENLWRDPSLPAFGLKADLVTALYQLYVFCPDLTTQRRIISLLRSWRRREIVWDSIELAEFLDTDLTCRQLGIPTPIWPDIGPSLNGDVLLVFKPGGHMMAKNEDQGDLSSISVV
ncbi:hypothetical protein HJFPF1_10868 [Paramyrothecium foliicola]|nr:hypothetical protein HJFPF1_10868 [Paramyrothecium foliicola]